MSDNKESKTSDDTEQDAPLPMKRPPPVIKKRRKTMGGSFDQNLFESDIMQISTVQKKRRVSHFVSQAAKVETKVKEPNKSSFSLTDSGLCLFWIRTIFLNE